MKDRLALYEFYNEKKSNTPFLYNVSFEEWEESMYEPEDFYGNELFQDLHTIIEKRDGEIIGYIQFGISNFVIDERGMFDRNKSMGIIRDMYFDKGERHVGDKLASASKNYFIQKEVDAVAAFHHHYGLKCFAGNGKLHEAHFHIGNLLKENDFRIESENIYYSKRISEYDRPKSSSSFKIVFRKNRDLIYFDLLLNYEKIGNGYFSSHGDICYLRWIFIESEYRGNGYGSEYLLILQAELYAQGYRKIDVDLEESSRSWQILYNRNGFIDYGRSRSYIREKAL